MTKWYGSIQNRISERSVKGQPEPYVGMGATRLYYSDRAAYTIVEVEKLKDGRFLIAIQADNAKRIDDNGMSEIQDYEYTPNPQAGKDYFRTTKEGTWQQVRKNVETGRWNIIQNGGLRIGDRDTYHDFSF